MNDSNKRPDNKFKTTINFNKLADTASTELIPWVMIFPKMSYKFLQIYWKKSEKLYVLYEIIVFPKAALNAFFFFQKSYGWLTWWTESDRFFYSTLFKVSPLLVHFQSSNSSSSFWMKGLADFDSFYEMKGRFWSCFILIANTKKWSNTLRQFLGCWRQFLWLGLIILWE